MLLDDLPPLMGPFINSSTPVAAAVMVHKEMRISRSCLILTDLTGQSEIGLAVWSFNALLFAVFSLLMLGRFILFSATIPKLFNHPNQSLFCGALPMAFSTITNGVVAFMVPRSVLSWCPVKGSAALPGITAQ